MEQELQQRLSQGESVENIVRELEVRWFLNSTTLEQRSQIGNFLLNVKRLDRLFVVLAKSLLNFIETPWEILTEALGVYPELPDHVLKYIETTLLDESGMGIAIRSHAMDKHLAIFRRQRALRIAEIKAQIQVKKRKLLDKLEYVRSQRLVEEEGRLLHELSFLDPNDNEVKQWLDVYKWRWAREVVSRQSASAIRLETPREEFTVEQTRILRQLLSQANATMDFAVMFYFFDDFDSCIEVLLEMPPDIARNWLLLFTLLAENRQLEALEVINRALISADSDPEIKLSLSYFKAQALYALGQKNEALDVMKQILDVAPHYRNGEQLMAIWEGKV